MRLLPGTSVTGVFQLLSDVQETVAFVSAPVSSTSLSADALVAPRALFQFRFATTPAVSQLPIALVFRPVKSMLMAPEASGNAIEDPQTRTVALKSQPRRRDKNV